jgi:hypothetical protein
VRADVALAHQVAEAQRGDGALGDGAALVELELDAGQVAALERDAGHRADHDAGDAHVVADQQAGDVAEGRPYLVLPPKPMLPMVAARVKVKNDVTIMNTTSFTREAEVFTRRSSPRA